MSLTLRSDAFEPGAEIPVRHTCEGDDLSPPLTWSDAPPGTESFALVVDDPDAPDPENPRTTWVHWVVYNLPPAVEGLVEGAGNDADDLPGGTLQGRNDWQRTGWGGPCPPIGCHRYFFKLYALDARLDDLGEPTKGELEAAMAGHVVGRVELVGTYRKRGPG